MSIHTHTRPYLEAHVDVRLAPPRISVRELGDIAREYVGVELEETAGLFRDGYRYKSLRLIRTLRHKPNGLLFGGGEEHGSP